MPEGRRKFEESLQLLMASKQDAIVLIPAIVGRSNEEGAKEVTVRGKTNYVYVRIYGQDSEVWQVYNDTAYVEYGTPIYIVKDIANPRQFKVYGRNSNITQTGISDKLLLQHGKAHSADTTDMTGKDITWVYRRQLVQPLLCQPQSLPNLTVYVNADYYSWKNVFKFFPGGSSPSLAVYLPAAGRAKYVTVYLAGDTNTVAIQDSADTFDAYFPPSSAYDYIPEVDPAVGIPLAAIKLLASTTGVTWKDMIDVRIFLYTSTGSNFSTSGSVANVSSGSAAGISSNVPRLDHVHALSFSLPLSWSSGVVGVADGAISLNKLQNLSALTLLGNSGSSAGPVTSITAPGDSTQFLNGSLSWSTPAGGSGGAGHEHALARWLAAAGDTALNLPDFASQVNEVTVGGLVLDPVFWNLSSDGGQVLLTSALTANTTVSVSYVLEEA